MVKPIFAYCKVELSPDSSPNGILFETDVTKRELPTDFLNSVEKSLHDSALGGSMAGYPIIHAKTRLTNVEFREDEAGEVAFSIAAATAFRNASQNAGPQLLEPIMDLEVITPADYTGDVIADLNSKRGKILNIGNKKDKDILSAEVPLSEMFGYSTDLRSKSQGRASFTMNFKRYEATPADLAKSILEKRGIFI